MATRTPRPHGTSERATFTVDTQLFRELGELLVGRDATALLELLKNSYDADATVVTVHGQGLRSDGEGSIIVSDNGTGMTLAQFREGFLRLAGRSKTSGERRSSRYGRRYTGEKGVGRLAAHKLASLINIDSVPWSGEGKQQPAVLAQIDWNRIESRKSLDDAGDLIRLESYVPTRSRTPGTEISLSHLRHTWTDQDLTSFVADAETFSPPEPLVYSKDLRARLQPSKILFNRPRVRDQRSEDSDPGLSST